MSDAEVATETEQKGKLETKADYVRKSYDEVKKFFDELRDRGLTTHFKNGEYSKICSYFW